MAKRAGSVKAEGKAAHATKLAHIRESLVKPADANDNLRCWPLYALPRKYTELSRDVREVGLHFARYLRGMRRWNLIIGHLPPASKLSSKSRLADLLK